MCYDLNGGAAVFMGIGVLENKAPFNGGTLQINKWGLNV